MNPVSKASISLISNTYSLSKRLNDQFLILLQETETLQPKTPRGKIHDLRVLTRRLRAFCGVLRKVNQSPELSNFRKSLRNLTQFLGPVRSDDVSYGNLKKRFYPSGQESHSLDFILDRLNQRRKKLRKKMVVKVQAKILKKFKKVNLPELMENIFQNQYLPILRQQSQKLAGRILENWRCFEKKEKISDLHRIRINLKKWRYLLEIKAEMAGAPSEDFLLQIKAQQDCLGLIHDTEVLRELLKNSKIKKDAKKKKVQKDLQALRNELKSEMRQGIKTFRAEGENFLLPLISMGEK
jgi:CHAD domain-containing protein